MDRKRITSVETNRTKVTAAKLVLADDLAGGCGEFRLHIRNPNPVHGSRGVQALEMSVHPKHARSRLGSITTNPLENAASVMQPVRGEVHGGRVPRYDLAVLPDKLGFFKSHR